MRLKILSLLSVTFLCGCAYMVDTANQEITVVTPGAEGAVCYLYVEGLKYRIDPPQSTVITKSKEDLTIDCRAPGNRRREVVIGAEIADNTAWNLTNGGIGLPWDYISEAMFEYPSTIEVSFKDMPTRPESLPAQNNPDIKQPEEYPLEEFKPGLPRMNSDKNRPPVEIQTRQSSQPMPLAPESDAFFEIKDMGLGKGNLQDVIDSYGGAIDPGAASNEPTPIIPGE